MIDLTELKQAVVDRPPPKWFAVLSTAEQGTLRSVRKMYEAGEVARSVHNTLRWLEEKFGKPICGEDAFRRFLKNETVPEHSEPINAAKAKTRR